MIRKIKIEALACECDICHYQWVSVAVEEPECCRSLKCRSRQWNGPNQKSHVREIRLPAPRKRGRTRSVALIDINRGDMEREG